MKKAIGNWTGAGFSKLFIFLLIMGMLLFSSSFAGSETVIEWHGHHLTPMHYATLYNQQFKVRVACDDVPLSLLNEFKNEFEMLYPDGSSAYPIKWIKVLNYTVHSYSGDVTTDFFDVYFKYKNKDEAVYDALLLRIGENVMPHPLPDGKKALEKCSFVTDEGAYVITYYSEEEIEALGKQYADTFNGQKVRLYLDGYIKNGESKPEYAASFLSQFAFKELSLATSLDISLWKNTECLTELDIPGSADLPACPNLVKLKYTLNRYGGSRLPDFEKLPSLTEMVLLLRAEWPGDEKDLLNDVTRPVKICPSLKTIDIISERGSILSGDPEFRIWLAAMRAASGSLVINGKEAGEYDLAEDMDEKTVAAIRSVESDAMLLNLYKSTLDQIPKDMPVEGKIVVLVISETGMIQSLSTDADARERFEAIPKERLAELPEEADTLMIVYPTYAVVGKYAGSFEAKSCTTMIAAVDMKTGALISRSSIITRQPPQTITLGSGQGRGTYEIDMGIGAISKLL